MIPKEHRLTPLRRKLSNNQLEVVTLYDRAVPSHEVRQTVRPAVRQAPRHIKKASTVNRHSPRNSKAVTSSQESVVRRHSVTNPDAIEHSNKNKKGYYFLPTREPVIKPIAVSSKTTQAGYKPNPHTNERDSVKEEEVGDKIYLGGGWSLFDKNIFSKAPRVGSPEYETYMLQKGEWVVRSRSDFGYALSIKRDCERLFVWFLLIVLQGLINMYVCLWCRDRVALICLHYL